MQVKEREISHTVYVHAPAECVWKHITDVDIASFHHPAYLSVLGIPKPLRAEILADQVGGARIAYFDNDKRFTQEITSWQPFEQYSFTFRPDPGFRVGHILDLADGPFYLKSGMYTLAPLESGIKLVLKSWYELRGVSGICLSLPVWLVLNLFQRYLLQGIKANAERDYAQGNYRDRDRSLV